MCQCEDTNLSIVVLAPLSETGSATRPGLGTNFEIRKRRKRRYAESIAPSRAAMPLRLDGSPQAAAGFWGRPWPSRPVPPGVSRQTSAMPLRAFLPAPRPGPGRPRAQKKAGLPRPGASLRFEPQTTSRAVCRLAGSPAMASALTTRFADLSLVLRPGLPRAVHAAGSLPD
jgi:hypothetical protein